MVAKTEASSEKKGKAMTIWWLCLSLNVIVVILINLVVFTPGLPQPPGHGILNMLRGMCAASALCVGIGYYGFAISFSYVQKPILIRQLHWKHKHWLPYRVYFILDAAIHVGATSTQFYTWSQHISLRSIAMTYSFHRFWSFYHSRGTTLYYTGNDVYSFRKNMPLWAWQLMYVVEGANCALCALWCLSSGRF